MSTRAVLALLGLCQATDGTTLSRRRSLSFVGLAAVDNVARGQTDLTVTAAGGVLRVSLAALADDGWQSVYPYWGGSNAEASGFSEAQAVYVTTPDPLTVIRGFAANPTVSRKVLINLGPEALTLSSVWAVGDGALRMSASRTLLPGEAARLVYDVTDMRWLINEGPAVTPQGALLDEGDNPLTAEDDAYFLSEDA